MDDKTHRGAAHRGLFSHLTGLASFHQSALHVLQPGEGKREREGGMKKEGKQKWAKWGKWRGEGGWRGNETEERKETEIFERGKKFEHSTLADSLEVRPGEEEMLKLVLE